MFKIKTYNTISVKGLNRFARDKFEVASDIGSPDAYILRSHKLHGEPLPTSVKAVARAGARARLRGRPHRPSRMLHSVGIAPTMAAARAPWGQRGR